MLPHNTLVAVADGHAAILFRNSARHGIELTEVERVVPPRGADHSVAAFAEQLAGHLNALVLRRAYPHVAIIADPATLSVMREHYHEVLRACLVREVSRTLTASSALEIAKALRVG